MRELSERQALIGAVAYSLRQLRPLLRRIAVEKHPPLDPAMDAANITAERIVEHLERSRYEVRPRDEQPKRHATP